MNCIFRYVDVFVHIYVYWCSQGNRVSDVVLTSQAFVSHMSRHWELTSGPLQEQLLLTAEQTVKNYFL